MQSDAETVEDYLATFPEDRREALRAIRDTVNASLDDGFTEGMEYGMVTWGIPFERYPRRTITPEQHIARYEESRALTKKGR